jgi:hypothetical protein
MTGTASVRGATAYFGGGGATASLDMKDADEIIGDEVEDLDCELIGDDDEVNRGKTPAPSLAPASVSTSQKKQKVNSKSKSKAKQKGIGSASVRAIGKFKQAASKSK